MSVKTRNVEPVEALRKRYLKGQEAVGRVIAAPGCGFSSGSNESIQSVESARRKLTNLAAAVKLSESQRRRTTQSSLPGSRWAMNDLSSALKSLRTLAHPKKSSKPRSV